MPNLTITNYPDEGPNIALYLPINLDLHVVTDNQTWTVEEAFSINSLLVANTSVKVINNNLTLS